MTDRGFALVFTATITLSDIATVKASRRRGAVRCGGVEAWSVGIDWINVNIDVSKFDTFIWGGKYTKASMGGRGRKTHAKKGYRIRMPSAITYAGHKTTYHSPQRHPRPSSDFFPYLKTILCKSIYIRKCKWYTVRILIYNSGSNYIIAIMLTAVILRIRTTVMITRVGEIRISKFNARKRITEKWW